MPRIDVHHQTTIQRSFRLDQAAGIFDLPVGLTSDVSFSVHVPPETDDWTIGAIIGPSGSGKSSVARQWLAERFVMALDDWPADRCILDGFPEHLTTSQITATLSAVGFSSPPDWLRPHRCLSTGQKFRADLARVLLTPGTVAMDEFGGTVSAQVAEFCARSVAKAVRRGHVASTRFVGVGARGEFAQWLEADWVLDMSERRLVRGWVRQERNAHPEYFHPPLPIDITLHRGNAADWTRFKNHHYLSANLNRVARVYLAWTDHEPIAFVATLPQPGPWGGGYRRTHRLVVLPDFQGLGIGLRVLDAVAEHETASGDCRRFSISTSHPALIKALHRRSTWRMTKLDRGNLTKLRNEHHRHAAGRVTAAFVYSTRAA